MYPPQASDAQVRALIRELTVDGVAPSGAVLRAALAERFGTRGGVARIYRLLADERQKMLGSAEVQSSDALTLELARAAERAARAEAREEAHQARWAREVDTLRLRVAELEPLATEARSSQEVIQALRRELHAAELRLAALEEKQMAKVHGRESHPMKIRETAESIPAKRTASGKVTASLLYNHLICPHRVAMDALADPATRDPVSPFVQLLWERGALYEREVIAGLGIPFVDLSTLAGEAKEKATREAIARREALIYNGRLSIEELLGEPDLLRLEGDGYVAIDIKSGAGEEGGDEDLGEEGKPKKKYGVQIALYTDILTRLGVSAGRYGFIWDVHGEELRYELDAPLGPRSPSIGEVYVEARAAVTATLDRSRQTQPAAAFVCKQCVWRSTCLSELKASNDLTLLPELGRVRRDSLAGQFPTVADLAAAQVERFIHGKKTDFKGVGPDMLRKFRARAALASAATPAPYLTRPVTWPNTPVELYFDIETDPLRDLVYLHGFVIRERGRGERFEGVFMRDVTAAAERAAFAEAIGIFRQHRTSAVIHYSPYERTHYRKLQQKYPDVCRREEIDALYAPPRGVDLHLDIVKTHSEWPTMDFSIKSLATYCGFKWRDTDPSGASSIEWFDQWAKTRDPALRQRLLDYNEDDCRAMRVVLDAMKRLALKH